MHLRGVLCSYSVPFLHPIAAKMSAFLPKSDTPYTIDALATLLQQSELLLGCPTTLQLRTVAVRSSGGAWTNYGTLLWVVPAGRPEHDVSVVEMDAVTLIATEAAPQSINSADDLRVLLTTWRLIVGASSGYPLQSVANAERQRSRNRWLEDPGWVIEVVEQSPDSRMASTPRGPFLHLASGTFAPTVQQLAAEWLRDPLYTNPSASRGDYRIVVPDLRARIDGLTLDGSELTVVRAGFHVGDLRLGVSSRTARGGTISKLIPIADEAATVEVPPHYETIDVWLLAPDGSWLDHYYETEYQTAWESRLRQKAPATAEADSLSSALANGESTRFEFKEWVHLSRHDAKAQQILRTACAFSNTDGGVLFIGVNDNLEPVGIQVDLRKAYPELQKEGSAQIEEAYLRDLKKLLAEGLDPLPRYTTEWITFTQKRILAIKVQRGTEGTCFLASCGEAYTRTGGNSRRIRHSDIPELRTRSGLPEA
jgi:hypothetical protein